jgi:uncharacterized protein (TIGR03083 family)
MTSPRSLLTALTNSHDRLMGLIAGFSEGDLEGRSYDTDWTVAQVLSHLGSGAEIFSMILDAALAGDEAPGPEAFPPVWDRWNAMSPAEQADNCRVSDSRFQYRLGSLDDAQLASLHLSTFGMELDASAIARLRLGEHALHTWDVAVVGDPAAEVASDAAALLVDNLGQLVARAGKPEGGPLRVHVKTTDPERSFRLIVGDSVELTPTTDGDADAEVTLPAAAFVRLVYGRLDPDHTPAGLTTSGVELEQLRKVFPGV